MKTYNIAVIKGDGVGPEVVDAALMMIAPIEKKFDIKFDFNFYPYSTQFWLDNNKSLDFNDDMIAEILGYDAVFMGSIGDPRAPVGLIEREIIGGLRWRGDLYVNLRPVKLISDKICPIKNLKPEDVDFVVIRENTEDAYPGVGGNMKKGFPDEVAVSVALYSRSATERIVRYAFEYTRKAGRKKITLFDKANAIPAQDIYRRVLTEIGKNEYPEIEIEFMFIDSACMWVIRDPGHFDVVLTTNLFGDIFTDLAAEVQGGLGIAASGCINPKKAGLFEPVHGSAPQHAGQGVVNPIAQINSLVMLLDYIGEKEASQTLEDAVSKAIIENNIPMTIEEIIERNLSTHLIAEIIKANL